MQPKKVRLNHIERMQRRIERRKERISRQNERREIWIDAMTRRQEARQIRSSSLKEWLNYHGGRTFRDVSQEEGKWFILLYDGRERKYNKKYLPDHLIPTK